MSLIFTHHDHRTDVCDHYGMLSQEVNGSRTCLRCGTLVETSKAESFMEPAGRKSSRQSKASSPR